ncbi:MAG TPA: haloacid dehalogenase-like hydrolase [Gammaproteobacteria bacterium]|nr:haloacid dehalogenase-like hydrolase [Gammaproteobacteria bacterium]
MHLVMFDIDGTLVDSAGFDAELYVEAVRSVLNVSIHSDWDAYEHVSDSGILEQVLRTVRPDSEHATLAARVQERFVALVRDYLRRAPGAVREIAGAKLLIERLLGLPNVRVGVATGGWEPTAKLKLAHVGIGTERIGFASSSDAPVRTDIMQLAAQRALHGAKCARATYFGDGAWDRRASAELGWDFVAVGAGVAHAVAYADLRATDAILSRLGCA